MEKTEREEAPDEPEELPTFQETDTADSGDGEPDAE